MRTERDSMGEMSVPDDALYGASTQRAVLNFPVSGRPLPEAFIRSLGLVKLASAQANAELGRLAPELARLIEQAAREVADGRWTAQFPVDVFQTGSATSTHTNANEVIANRCSQLAGQPIGSHRPVHPNDHVNLGQSSNDVIPTALHVSVAGALHGQLRPALDLLAAELERKAAAFAGLIKIGRTHLMDATPLTLGQEFSGYAAQVRKASERAQRGIAVLGELAIGGTAVGTGLNAHPQFAERAIAELAHSTGLPFVPAPNRFEALAAHDALVHAHGVLKSLAAALVKIANDVRWLASGPRSGLGELTIPENEPGSSIMPGKVNPTQCEALTMACAQVFGNDVAIGFAGSQGNFELNVYKPLIIHAFLQSTRLLADGMDSFRRHCALGIEPNLPRIRELLDRSLMLVTALNRHIGYDRAAAIARKAHTEGLTLKEAALALGFVSAEQFDEWVRPEQMLGPGTD